MTAIWKALPTANTITLRNITSPGAIYITGGATNISIIGGQVYSPVPVSTDSQIASLYGKAPTNILFDGVSFHDFRDIGPGNLHHIECLQVGAAVNLTIQNSTFQNCETHDLFIRSWGFVNNSPYPLTNILIKNNTFAPTYTGYYSMQVLDDLWTGQPPTSVTIANNTFQQGIHVYITTRHRPHHRQHPPRHERLPLQRLQPHHHPHQQHLRLRHPLRHQLHRPQPRHQPQPTPERLRLDGNERTLT